MREGLVDSHHIHWDQACVLTHVGLLDPAGLPVTGAEQHAALKDDADDPDFNALLSN